MSGAAMSGGRSKCTGLSARSRESEKRPGAGTPSCDSVTATAGVSHVFHLDDSGFQASAQRLTAASETNRVLAETERIIMHFIRRGVIRA